MVRPQKAIRVPQWDFCGTRPALDCIHTEEIVGFGHFRESFYKQLLRIEFLATNQQVVGSATS